VNGAIPSDAIPPSSGAPSSDAAPAPGAADPSPAALLASGLGKRYGARRALESVDLEVRAGELVGLLGPNGAGKSTLTKIACGLVRPTEGRVTVCGAPAGSPSARAEIGYLAELFRFPGWATADEVLVLHQRLAGSSGGEGERAPSFWSSSTSRRRAACASSACVLLEHLVAAVDCTGDHRDLHRRGGYQHRALGDPRPTASGR